jgi:NAD(P)-dependent dehydrogenase (short-subunit alcohol dehydrogenase family)
VDKGALIVTGSGRGIGAATARLAAAHGYAVCVNFASNRAAADALVGDIIDAGGEAFAQRADVARREEVAALFEAVDQRYGGLAGLVNNAGVAGRVSPLAEADPVTIDRVIDVNVKGTIWCSQEAVRRMSTALGGKGGAIVNISSGSATIGSPGQYVWYAASKGAVDSLTMGLAKELAPRGRRRSPAPSSGFSPTRRAIRPAPFFAWRGGAEGRDDRRAAAALSRVAPRRPTQTRSGPGVGGGKAAVHL